MSGKNKQNWTERKARALRGLCQPPKGGEHTRYMDKQFIAVDSEGMNYGEPEPFFASEPEARTFLDGVGRRMCVALESGQKAPFELVASNAALDSAANMKDFQRHRTFLWGAGNEQRCAWLGAEGAKAALTSHEILDWLCSLRLKRPSAIFVAFAFSYDATQALADLDLESMQEIQESGRKYVLWNEYALRYVKGKYLTVRRLRDPACPYRRTEKGKIKINADPPITIYDVWGFFQCGFLAVLKGGFDITPTDTAIIERGKSERLDFTKTPLSDIMDYTSAEIRALVRVMNQIRSTLKRMELSLARWNGAGSIASAAFKKHGTAKHYWPISCRWDEQPEFQQAALHAYFGGRIELFKYGCVDGPVYSYDIVSAYPHAQSTLPSMRGGRWVYHECARTAPEPYFTWSPLSMVEVRWNPARAGHRYPIGPFPYRTQSGAIFYPLNGWGVYCVEEVLAADRAIFSGMPTHLEVKQGWQFVTDPGEELPFAWIYQYYTQRRALKAACANGAPYDLREKILKLAMNASYGKCAQRVGGERGEKPPSTANPWYAACITARVRARMLDTAMLAPDNIIMIATDGIYSRAPLPLIESHELGGWEPSVHPSAKFVQSGVYFLAGERKTNKTRGIRMEDVGGGSLSDSISAAWRNGAKTVDYAYRQYITVGMAARNENWRRFAGYWARARRTLDVVGCGVKRLPGRVVAGAPCKRLIKTFPAEPPNTTTVMSAPRLPEWLDTAEQAEFWAQIESSEVEQTKFE